MAEQEQLLSVPGWWVTGLVDGEGCFYANLVFRSKNVSSGRQVSCVELDARLAVALRADDAGTLTRLQDFFGCGTVTRKRFNPDSPSKRRQGQSRSRPQQVFQIRRPEDLLRVVLPHFEAFPLQSKKARDFEVWKRIVEFATSELVGRKGWLRRFPEKIETLVGLCSDLKSVRIYPEGN